MIQGKKRKRTVLWFLSMRGGDCFLFFGIILLLGLVMPAYAEMGDETLLPSGLQEARVDLHSKTFLDPLPFDTSFLISGRVPSAIDYVEVMTSEFVRETVSFGSDPQRVEIFYDRVYTFLDTTLTVGMSPLMPSDLRWLRNRLVNMLTETIEYPGRWSRRFFSNFLPWNWSNWAEHFEHSELYVIAPGTVFDLDDLFSSTSLRFAAKVNEIITVDSRQGNAGRHSRS